MSLNDTLIFFKKKINLILAHQCILILPKKKKKKKIAIHKKIIRTFYKNDMVVGFPKTIPGFGDHCSS